MKILKVLSLTAIVFLLTQCYPAGPEYIEELDLVYTNYDPATDFTAMQTYAMPDSIMKIDDDLIAGGNPNFVKPAYAGPMLQKIKDNMEANGWKLREKNDNPDIILAPVAYELTTTYYYGGGYWDWWYGGWYGWYYPYPVTTSYSTGSLIVTMLDPKNESPDGKMRAVWGFVVNGLLEGSTTEFTNRYTKGINQAFTQSPYLKIN